VLGLSWASLVKERIRRLRRFHRFLNSNRRNRRNLRIAFAFLLFAGTARVHGENQCTNRRRGRRRGRRSLASKVRTAFEGAHQSRKVRILENPEDSFEGAHLFPRCATFGAHLRTAGLGHGVSAMQIVAGGATSRETGLVGRDPSSDWPDGLNWGSRLAGRIGSLSIVRCHRARGLE
jgi:hypothetical protein